jgi:hypothetical protein
LLRHPQKDAWRKWGDSELWCTIFFSIISPGGSKVAREYLGFIERGGDFELKPDRLISLSRPERISAIWEFGKGKNVLNKSLARFFSRSGNVGSTGTPEYKLANIFEEMHKRGFMEFLHSLDAFKDERLKAKQMEFLPGVKLKVSRDFLNNIGMTDTLIPLDRHILDEMKTIWGWNAPKNTPSKREDYEAIEDTVRHIADEINSTVMEIDKSIFSARAAR